MRVTSKLSKVKALYSVFFASFWLCSVFFHNNVLTEKTDLFKSLNLVDVDLKPRLVIKSGHYILPSNLYHLSFRRWYSLISPWRKERSKSRIGETSKVCNIDILFLIHPVWYDLKLYAAVYRGNIFTLKCKC